MKHANLAALVVALTSPLAGAGDPIGLFGMDRTSGDVLSIDTATGAATPFISTGLSNAHGLAYVPSEGLFYTASRSDDSLWSIDPTTGVTTLVGALSVSSGTLHSLAYDPGSDTLYGLRFSGRNSQLMSIDRGTGDASPLQFVSDGSDFPATIGLAHDPASGDLFTVDIGAPERLLSMDPSDSVGDSVDFPLSSNTISIAFDAGQQTVYAIDNRPGGGAGTLIS